MGQFKVRQTIAGILIIPYYHTIQPWRSPQIKLSWCGSHELPLASDVHEPCPSKDSPFAFPYNFFLRSLIVSRLQNVYKMSTMRCAVRNGNKTKPVKSKNYHRIDDFKYQQKRLREILGFLDRVEVEGRQIPETLTDEQFNSLGIELIDLGMKTGQTPPSTTRYFLPATDDASGVSSSATGPIDDRFTQYNKSRAKRVW